MTDDEKAAEVYIRKEVICDSGQLGSGSLIVLKEHIGTFKAGIAYARANPGPEVLRLVGTLNLIVNSASSFGFEAELYVTYAKDALAAWRSIKTK